MNFYIRFNQIFLWLGFRLFLMLSGSKYKTNVSKYDIPRGAGVILAGNHQSQLDPFVLGAAMPFSLDWKLIPVRFMAYAELFANPILKFFLRAFGAFPTKEIRDLGFGLPFSTQVLQSGGTVCIFPEGKRTKQGQAEAKRGVAILAELDNTVLIPVRLDWQKTRFSKKVRIIIDKPISAKGLSPQEIMDTIYNLPLPGKKAVQ